MSDTTLVGLAAAARAAGDPRVTVTALVRAIEAGTITPTVENGKNLITLEQAMTLVQPAQPEVAEPDTTEAPAEAEPAPAPIKIKSKTRRGGYGDRNPKGSSGTQA